MADQAGRAGAVVALAAERRVGKAVSLSATSRAGATLGAGAGWPVGAARHPVVMSGAGTGSPSPFPRCKAAIVANLYCVAALRQDIEALAIGVARDVLRHHHSRHATEEAVAGVLGPAVLEQGQAVEMFIYILHRQVAFALDGNGRVAVHHQQIDLGAILAGIIAADQMLHGAMHL